MKKATYIKAEDLSNLQKDESGNYQIPEHIEIYIKEDPEVLKQERIIELENELLQMDEPTDQELIEEGKMMHPYYMLEEELKRLKG